MNVNIQKKYLLTILVAALVIVLDQITKYLIVKSFALHQSFDLVEHYLTIVYIRNKGIAFGLLAGQGGETRVILLVVASLLAIAFIMKSKLVLGEVLIM